MLTAIARYGARVVPDMESIIDDCRRRGELVSGPHIAEFERAIATRLGGGRAVATSYGRMAFYHILRALELPEGSEIVFPALTFWVMPEMARVAGLRPVFADVDAETFNLDPESLARAITPRTRAVVPTHIYGLPCDMEEIVSIARRHDLKVIEDCAHALGASYHGAPTGTLGDAAIFSFQILKPLNTLGGGMAFTRDAPLAARVRRSVESDPPPTPAQVLKKLRMGRLEIALMSPVPFSLLAFPILWTASWLNARPDVYLWEKIRPLKPLPDEYHLRYSNAQAAIGLASLGHLDAWTEATRANARALTRALAEVPRVGLPPDPHDRTHVYYQYCAYVADREAMVRRSIRAGLDVEYHHMDVCSELSLFGDARTDTPGARRTRDAVQLPVYASLSAARLAAVARRAARAARTGDAATRAAAEAARAQ